MPDWPPKKVYWKACKPIPTGSHLQTRKCNKIKLGNVKFNIDFMCDNHYKWIPNIGPHTFVNTFMYKHNEP